MIELCDLPAHVLVDRFNKGEITAVSLMESVLNRVQLVEGRSATTMAPRGTHREDFAELHREDIQKVHAYITLRTEYGLEKAREIDSLFNSGKELGPLAGIPLAVKDIFCVADTPSTAGSKILESFISPYTASAVKRLEQAGAIVIGKTNLDEFGYGSSNESTAFLPPPGNPWNPSLVPGGSSGGSAAAVASGETIIALGSDTSGSIRQPAAFCGVVGLKPTYGRVSRYGLIAFASSMDCVGPMTKDVEDSALMMSVMSGTDRRDATSANLPRINFSTNLGNDIRGTRIGLSPEYFRLRFPDTESGKIDEQPIAEDIKQSVIDAAEKLAGAGAEIIENVPMPTIDYCVPAYFVISRVEAASNLHRYDGVKYGHRTQYREKELRNMYRRTRQEGFGLQPKLRILTGIYVSAAQYAENYYERALRVRTLIKRDFDSAFDKGGKYRCDALLTPTTPNTAFSIGEVYGDSVRMQYNDLFTVSSNLAGVPAISIPSGLDSQGMPIGIQLIGPHFSEENLLRIGRAYEIVTANEGWRNQIPEILNM